jgi:hypothetical protein
MIKVFLDSGAYSAWKLGPAIDLDEYIAFLKSNKDLLDCYIGLDLIPGDGVVEWRPDKIEGAARASYDNHCRMKDAGLTPIPVFHHGEAFDWLKRYLDGGEQLIAVSVKGNAYQAMAWLDDVFVILKRWSGVKAHGLGLTSLSLLRRYPFASVDSGTWLKQSAIGQIPIPRYLDGRPNYRLPHQTVSVTDKARGRRNHVEQLAEFERDRLDAFLNDEVGIELAQARASPKHRWRCWLTFFRAVQTMYIPKIVPVTDGRQCELLVKQGFNRHLLSYYKLRTKRASALQEYVLSENKV